MMSRIGIPANARRNMLDDFFVPNIDFYTKDRLFSILKRVGFTKLNRWKRGHLDHEENIFTYRQQFLRWGDFASRAAKMSNDLYELVAFEVICEAVQNIIKFIDSVAKYDPKKVREGIIGQGHHRILVCK